MRAMLIANPKATSTSRRARDLLVRAFSGDLDLVIADTAHRGHATEIARRAALEGYDAVIALGGDGTVNEAVNGLLAEGPSPDLPALAVLPIGSANVFARALGLPGDPIGATRVVLDALRAGRYRTVGLGTACHPGGTERYFTFCGGVGFDAEVVREVERRRGAGAKADPSLYVRTAIRHFFSGTDRRRPALTMEVPGRPTKSGVFMAFISNTAPWTFMGPVPVNPSPKANFSRGLDVFATRTLDAAPTLAALARMMTPRTRPVQGRHVVNVHDAAEITLRAERPVAFQLDGDYLGEQELITFRSVPKAIRIVI
ncbi:MULTISPECIES: diacylglycerol kinase family protein [Actinomadura]|uniref:Diacylglycerol kinase family lipid kinase n=1 Tax=Actinomadura litoris TaxID=2678616 RepID=A0A7K1LCZ9_9ACTN|nr:MULTISPECIES: diacylglycerol kinase family protein [Actinomadura]MBT2208425.1 diacylglycerol kinase family lipid kinase [Actinomadura sp. NEAU-AAG7]MUN42310.1 diacylglycerol kinase family lipid kinase [Actinomadura litoris]